MANLLRTAIGWLDTQRKASLSDLVTYRRGSDEVEIAATPGTSEEEVFDSGTSMRAKRSDFIVTAADLVLDGETITPTPGDQIDSGGKTYEVMALSDGRHFVEFPGGITLRIHAKLVDE